MMRIAVTLAVASVLIGAGLVKSQLKQREFTTASGEAYELYRAGEEHLGAFQWNEAVTKLEEATALDPAFAMATSALAFGYARQGHAEKSDSLVARADSLAALLADDQERMLVELRQTA